MVHFRIVISDRPLKRRGILFSSVYDPLGILAPTVLSAKIILQELCRQKLGWDSPIPSVAAQQWINLLKELHQLEHFQVSRCLRPPEFGKVTEAHIHHFSDASENGYGAVTYLHLHNTHAQQLCHGKVQGFTVEGNLNTLYGANSCHLRNSLGYLLIRELHMSLKKSVFRTDSTSVLKYIKNETSRFRTFVANKILRILKVSQPSQWRHINTGSNPADAVSRGQKTDIFLKSTIWLSGPVYLLQLEQGCPVSPHDLVELLPNDSEAKVKVSVNVASVEMDATISWSIIFHLGPDWEGPWHGSSGWRNCCGVLARGGNISESKAPPVAAHLEQCDMKRASTGVPKHYLKYVSVRWHREN